MTRLHAFGCSITQGFALPDIVRPLTNDQGQLLTNQEIEALVPKFHWTDVHIYEPSKYAWPKVLGDKLGLDVINHARRGACFQQISRQCAAGVQEIKPNDLVIVMWTYLSRLSIQWPARTSVPFNNCAVADWGWRTAVTGFNKLFGLSPSLTRQEAADERIQEYIEKATKHTYMDPLGIYNRYYNSLVLQTMTDGFLRSTGARVIHLSVEPESYLDQLETARQYLDESLRDPYTIAHPDSWYTMKVDHDSCMVLLDPSIPPAENDTHPSILHHSNFAEHVYNKYFQ